jgi:hypothetical protein
VRLWIISVCVKKYQQAFLAPLSGKGCCTFFEPSSSSYLYLFFFYIKTQNIFIMKPTSYQNLSASKGEFHEPFSKPNLSSGSELHPSLKVMVQA